MILSWTLCAADVRNQHRARCCVMNKKYSPPSRFVGTGSSSKSSSLFRASSSSRRASSVFFRFVNRRPEFQYGTRLSLNDSNNELNDRNSRFGSDLPSSGFGSVTSVNRMSSAGGYIGPAEKGVPSTTEIGISKPASQHLDSIDAKRTIL